MKHILTTPISDEAIRGLRVGDIVYLTGLLHTGRDDVHERVVKEGRDCPVDLNGMAIFHAGPIVQETEDGEVVVAIGPTSSIRMESTQAEFIEKTGVRLMIGKGGMGPKTSAACKMFGAVHCVSLGGCAVTAASRVKRIRGAFWRELGIPECVWALEVSEYGPLIVSIDTQGNNMFEENKAYFAGRLDECKAPILERVRDYMKIE